MITADIAVGQMRQIDFVADECPRLRGPRMCSNKTSQPATLSTTLSTALSTTLQRG